MDNGTLPDISYAIAFGIGRSFDEHHRSCHLVGTFHQPITSLLTTILRQFVSVVGILALGRSRSHGIP